MRTLGSLEKASASTRRHVTLYKDDVAMGEQPTYLWPKTLAAGSGWWGIRMSLGRKPETGRRAYVFACSRAPFPAEKNLAVRLNGELIRPCANPRCANFEEPLKGVAAFEIPDGALFDDGNVIEFANDTGVPITLNRVEIYIEALE